MAKQETTADIIAWLRRPREGENAYLTLWRDEIADRLEAAHRREVATTKESLAVGNSGDCAKLREAVGYILKYADSVACRDHDEHTRHYIDQIRKWAQSALAAPPRNCDVGTAEELYGRYEKFCCSHFDNEGGNCLKCPFSLPTCKFAWAQQSYEEGGDK